MAFICLPTNAARHFNPEFQGFCLDNLGFVRIFRDFAQILNKSKFLGVPLDPLHPRLLHHWSNLIRSINANTIGNRHCNVWFLS